MDATQILAAFAAGFTGLIGAVVWIIKRVFERDERNTDRFLTAMETTVARNATAMEAISHSVTENTTTIREARAADREEHRGIIAAIGLLRRREFPDVRAIDDEANVREG